jgi:hypothetical protein
MGYRIYETEGHIRRTVAVDIPSIAEARAFLEGWGEVICFERDPDYDAADCALLRKSGNLHVYAIERN